MAMLAHLWSALGGRIGGFCVALSAAFAGLAILVLRLFRAGRESGLAHAAEKAAKRAAAARAHQQRELRDVEADLDRLDDAALRERLRRRWTRRR